MLALIALLKDAGLAEVEWDVGGMVGNPSLVSMGRGWAVLQDGDAEH